MRLPELQNDDKEAKKLRSEGLSEGWEDIEQGFNYDGFLYVPKFISSELIKRHYDNLFACHFDIKMTEELIPRKYYWPTLQRDVEAYVNGCDV